MSGIKKVAVINFLCLVSVLAFSCTEKDKQKQEAETEISSGTNESKKLVLFFGNSLTAGFGVEQEDAFPALIQEKLDSLGLDYWVINGGLSGETTASGKNRLDWFLEEEPAIFVLELGGNDGLRGIAVSETRKNLKEMIDLVKDKFPGVKILLSGMQIPPNMGQEYTESFSSMYKELAEEENVELIPFLLEGVAGNPELNLPDGIHPTEQGHLIVAETVWQHLKPLL